MDVVRVRPRPMPESEFWVNGVSAVLLTGELAPLRAEPFIKSP